MNKLKLFVTILGFFTLPVYFTGCSFEGNHPTDDPASPTGDVVHDTVFQSFTKIAAAEAISGDTELAAEIDEAIAQVNEFVEEGELVTPESVDTYIVELLNDSDLEPGTKQSLYTLADVLRTHYTARIDTGFLDPNQTASFLTVLGWVQEAAQDTIKFGNTPQYGNYPEV